MKKHSKVSLFILTSLINPLCGYYDNPHFYRATNFFFMEPRFEQESLTSLDFTFGAGGTGSGRNAQHEKVALFDIWGPNNMHELAVGVPNLNLNDPIDLLLKQLSLTTSRDCFATFSIDARIHFVESYLSITQNIYSGVYAQIIAPFRKISITKPTLCDLSPCDDACPNIDTPIWHAFKENFETILQKFNLSSAPYKTSGIGDTTILLGWTFNYDQTEIVDFIDVSLRAGILIPTAAQRNEHNIFAIPLGYNGHWAFPVSFAASIGIFEWLTIATCGTGLVFADKTREMRIQTGFNQSGIVKLAKTMVKVEKGSIWTASGFIKADHVCAGLSFTLAYTFANKNSDNLTPCDCACFDISAINNDEMLRSWKMHTVHLFTEIDFISCDNAFFGPRLGAFFNFVVGGKRIFNTNVGGINTGLEITWCF